ncbi:MAG: peptidase inhibitor I78 [Phenylobacterium sp.]
MKRALALACLVWLAGCAAPPPPPPLPPLPPVPPPAPPPPASDLCRAREHQDMVGRPRTEIPVPVNPADQRVACTTCPVTQDYNPRRLNFFFDAASGIVREVRCG